MSSVAELMNISKTYSIGEEVTPFEPIHLRIDAGDFLALTGESGCGKSTLLNITGGLLEPTQGNLLYSGQDYWKMSDRDRTMFRAQNIGFLFQSCQLAKALTIQENMQLIAKISGKKIDMNFILECLEHYGLLEKKDSIPQRLSGGQRRRAMLVATMIRKPKLIIADEPTNDLDDKWIEVVMKDFKTWAENGSAILMATHNQALVENASKRYEIKDKILTQVF